MTIFYLSKCQGLSHNSWQVELFMILFIPSSVAADFLYPFFSYNDDLDSSYCTILDLHLDLQSRWEICTSVILQGVIVKFCQQVTYVFYMFIS